MAANRRKAVSTAAGLKAAQPEPAQSRAFGGSSEAGGFAKPMDSARNGALGATGGAAGAAMGHSVASRASGGRNLQAEALETGKLLAAGGVAGAVSKSCTAPLARLTILYQVNLHGPGLTSGACQRAGRCILCKACLVIAAEIRFHSTLHPARKGSSCELENARPLCIAGAAGACCLCKHCSCWRALLRRCKTTAGGITTHAPNLTASLPLPTQVHGFAAGPGAAAQDARPPSMRQAFGAIVRSEGIGALWKGNGATIVHRLPYSAINFWAYERLTELWNASLPPERGHSHSMDVARRLTAGGAAGMCACTVVSGASAFKALFVSGLPLTAFHQDSAERFATLQLLRMLMQIAALRMWDEQYI